MTTWYCIPLLFVVAVVFYVHVRFVCLFLLYSTYYCTNYPVSYKVVVVVVVVVDNAGVVL